LFASRANQNFQQIFGDHDKGIVLKVQASVSSARPGTHAAGSPV
jgi:hypothetical protein